MVHSGCRHRSVVVEFGEKRAFDSDVSDGRRLQKGVWLFRTRQHKRAHRKGKTRKKANIHSKIKQNTETPFHFDKNVF